MGRDRGTGGARGDVGRVQVPAQCAARRPGEAWRLALRAHCLAAADDFSCAGARGCAVCLFVINVFVCAWPVGFRVRVVSARCLLPTLFTL